jgi:excisionase family DNA binding protein
MQPTAQIDWISDVIGQLRPMTTAAEASTALRTSPRNLRRMIADGRLRAVRSRESGSSRVLVPRVEIERYLRSLEVSA